MIKIRQGRDTYPHHTEMIDWCLENIGWSAYKETDVCEDAPFCHSQGFGHLFLTFYNDYDAFRFKMAWGGDKIDD